MPSASPAPTRSYMCSAQAHVCFGPKADIWGAVRPLSAHDLGRARWRWTTRYFHCAGLTADDLQAVRHLIQKFYTVSFKRIASYLSAIVSRELVARGRDEVTTAKQKPRRHTLRSPR